MLDSNMSLMSEDGVLASMLKQTKSEPVNKALYFRNSLVREMI